MSDQRTEDRPENVLDLPSFRLVQEAARSPKAIEEICGRLSPRVRRAVYLMTGGDPETNDLASICLAEILTSLKGYRGRGSLEAWADAVTYRVAMRELKRRRRRDRTILLKADLEAHRPAPADPPEMEVIRGRLSRILARHLEGIPQARRVTLVLRVLLGHSVAEVAEITGVPHNTVRSRIRRTLRQLRHSLKQEPEIRELLQEGNHGTE